MQCHLSISKMPYVVPVTFCLMSIRFMLPVDFEKRLCRPVEFKGQGLQLSYGYEDMCSGHKTTECIESVIYRYVTFCVTFANIQLYRLAD